MSRLIVIAAEHAPSPKAAGRACDAAVALALFFFLV
jgi:hypothetical protein